MVFDQYYPFEKISLPYGYDSLEPQISECTLFFHYNEHYLPAVEKLNERVKASPAMQNIPLEELAESGDKALRRMAEIVLAHEMYFLSLTDKQNEPSEYMKSRIAKDFGSAENFEKAVKDTASELYGSGFLWIAEDNAGRLAPLITKEHELPDRSRYYPVMAADLWEHAFYPDHRSSRGEYAQAVLSRLNWDGIESLLKSRK